MATIARAALLVLLCAGTGQGVASEHRTEHWFETFKREASPEDLYRLLYNMPKGGDLHNHLSGSGLSEWWHELATAEKNHGYRYYTRVRINNCRPYGGDEFGRDPYLLMFRNIMESTWQRLDACEQGEHRRLDALDGPEKSAWLNSLRLDKDHEGRMEFFEKHWQRLNELHRNPHLGAELLARNVLAFADEGLLYLEIMADAHGQLKPNGERYPPDEVVAIYKKRLAQNDVRDTGVVVRLQESVLRFAPDAEEQLKRLYLFVARNRDLYVGLNMVGREDNDKGHPRRFLGTLRELRRRHDVRLAIHGGEVDEPNDHVRDTLLLGAERIGHGLNLVTDDDTMRLMRHGPYLVEINLISNLLLEYISDYSQHPFPEYLRTGIPVALSTDDRGMWDSNMTDEFFVAVTEYNLGWEEIVGLSRNSLRYAFVEEPVKRGLLREFDTRIAQFERRFRDGGLGIAAPKDPVRHSFICRFYRLC